MYTERIELSKIKLLSKRYTSQKPSERKMEKRRKEYAKDKTLKIVVRARTYELLEGYTYYTLAQELGLRYVECSVASTNEKFLSAANIQEGIQIKNELFKKNNYRCYICNDKVITDCEEDNIDLGTVDHFLPRAKGGRSNMKNLRCCCRFCNNIKADKELTPEFRDYIIKEKRFARKANITTVSMYNLEKKSL